jgi:hypothetical protein
MDTTSDRAPQPGQPPGLAEQPLVVKASTTTAEPVGNAPDLSPGDNLALVFSPSLQFNPAGSSGPSFLCFGLTSGGPWAAAGPAPISESNVGASLPSGTYPLTQQDPNILNQGQFAITGDPSAPTVSTPNGALGSVAVSGAVITGTITIGGDLQTLAMTAHGTTLFGVMVGGGGGVEGGQTVGVYGAEASPPGEDEAT